MLHMPYRCFSIPRMVPSTSMLRAHHATLYPRQICPRNCKG